jgi:LmbE family N-acetylglucosaminyl deacetylase
MKILAIGAHPDDIEIGCAGSLLKYAGSGHDVYLFVMTPGEMGGEAEIRKKEQARSAEIMNVRDLFWGEYNDTKLTTHLSMISDIEAVVKKIKPDFVFVNYKEDTHQDHRVLSRAAVSATRYVKM